MSKENDYIRLSFEYSYGSNWAKIITFSVFFVITTFYSNNVSFNICHNKN